MTHEKPYPTEDEARRYESLPQAGFWALTKGDRSGLPWPADLVDPSWNVKEKEAVATYLDGGKVAAAYRGWSTCRICGKRNGSQDWTDGHFVYPEGLSHYVRDHSVKLPDPFLSHIRQRLRASMAGMSCPCEKTVELMTRLGAPQTALMHQKGAKQKPWAAVDWMRHIDEEEKVLFPRLRPYFPDQIDMLVAEHNVLLYWLKIYGKFPVDKFIDHHGNLEDQLVARYIETEGYPPPVPQGMVRMPDGSMKPSSEVFG